MNNCDVTHKSNRLPREFHSMMCTMYDNCWVQNTVFQSKTFWLRTWRGKKRVKLPEHSKFSTNVNLGLFLKNHGQIAVGVEWNHLASRTWRLIIAGRMRNMRCGSISLGFLCKHFVMQIVGSLTVVARFPKFSIQGHLSKTQNRLLWWTIC